jgi:hypothetical protein
LSLEESLDYKKVEKERGDLTAVLADKLSKPELKNLVSASLSYRLGNMSYGAFYRYLKDLCAAYGINLNLYPEMDKYIRYVLLSEKIKTENLFAEVGSLEKRRFRELIKSPEEKSLVEISQDIVTVGKLLGFALSPDEWENYQSRKEEIRRIPERIEKFGRNLSSSGSTRGGRRDKNSGQENEKAHSGPDTFLKGIRKNPDPSPQNQFSVLLESFEKFNEAAVSRNSVLVNHLLSKISEPRTPNPEPPASSFELVRSLKIKKIKQVLGDDGRPESLVLKIDLFGDMGKRSVIAAVSRKDSKSQVEVEGFPVTEAELLD